MKMTCVGNYSMAKWMSCPHEIVLQAGSLQPEKLMGSLPRMSAIEERRQTRAHRFPKAPVTISAKSSSPGLGGPGM